MNHLVCRLSPASDPSLPQASFSQIGYPGHRDEHSHFQAGSQVLSERFNTGFGTVFFVDPNDVYPSSYNEHHFTFISRKKDHMSKYVQSSIGCMRRNCGQDGSVGANTATSVRVLHQPPVGNISLLNFHIPPFGSPLLVPTRTPFTPFPPLQCRYSSKAAFIPPPNRYKSRP